MLSGQSLCRSFPGCRWTSGIKKREDAGHERDHGRSAKVFLDCVLKTKERKLRAIDVVLVCLHPDLSHLRLKISSNRQDAGDLEDVEGPRKRLIKGKAEG